MVDFRGGLRVIVRESSGVETVDDLSSSSSDRELCRENRRVPFLELCRERLSIFGFVKDDVGPGNDDDGRPRRCPLSAAGEETATILSRGSSI